MPGYVNIGAWVGPRTMVDTWATVGSCAQIGADVHLAGGVGIGGVLEPPQARPVIVEDGAFIGSRWHRRRGRPRRRGRRARGQRRPHRVDADHRRPRRRAGRAPRRGAAGAVVVPGTRTKEFPAGKARLPCAYHRRAQTPTDLKTSLNDALREHAVSI